MNLQDALGQFQVQLEADGRSEHTRKQYQRHVLGLIAWLEANGKPTKLGTLSPTTVAEFFASDAAKLSAHGGKKQATSVNAQRTSLRCFFRWAHESGLVALNPARLLRRARCAPPPPKALRDDEQGRLLKVLRTAEGPQADRDRMLVELLLGSGIRIGSAISLDVEDIDFAHGEVTLRAMKGDRPSTAVLSDDLVEKLLSFLDGRTSGPLFLAGKRRISMRHAQRRLADWFSAAGVRGRSAHALRHSFATGLLAKTGDLRLVQAAMNHKSIVSTTIYAGIDKDRLRAAVGA